MRRVALATADEESPKHLTGPHHPERPERVELILAHLRRCGLLEQLIPIQAQPAGLEWIELVHEPAYIRRVEQTCLRSEPVIDSMDTEISPGSYGAALHAAGAALKLCDAVVSGKASAGFAAMRPPGHHAEHALAMGFCLFNNAAIAARYLQKRHGLRRILIVDWDVHHGNGSQHAFEKDADVFYFSTHQYPHYPGTGAASEKGEGAGVGATLTLPMRAGSGDVEYRRAFEQALLPAALAFRPEAVLVSAGFDAHRDDPLGEIQLTEGMYGEMTRIVRRIAEESSAVGVISLLEGGYHPVAMPLSVESHLRALLQD